MEDEEDYPCGEDLITRMNGFHNDLMTHVSLAALQEPVEEVSYLYFRANDIKNYVILILIYF